jgi:Ni,Fe-hydrogenase III small subunit
VGDTIDEVIPVDVWVPGCPPRPQLIMDGIAQAARLLAEGRTADQQGRRT